MDKELIKETIKYIEGIEYTIEGELGTARSLDELIESGDMANLYYRLVSMLYEDLPK